MATEAIFITEWRAPCEEVNKLDNQFSTLPYKKKRKLLEERTT